MKATIRQASFTKFFAASDEADGLYHPAPGYIVEFKMPEWDHWCVAYTLYLQEKEQLGLFNEACDVIGTDPECAGDEEVFDTYTVLDWRVYQQVDI